MGQGAPYASSRREVVGRAQAALRGLLGRGKRLFDDQTQASALRLEESKISSTGVLVTRYVREGEVRTGLLE